MSETTYPVWRWERIRAPHITHVSLGADRFVEKPEPLPERHPLGFSPPKVEADPLLWEGDSA